MPKKSIKKLQRRARRVLKKLVTTRGIFASTDNGWKGSFHALFGRDSAITASLIFSAESLGSQKDLSYRAYRGLLRLRKWQGRRNNPASGEETGKISHEVRATDSRNPQTRARLLKYRTLWFWDPRDHFLKSWDSVDATPLWIIVVIRCHKWRNIKYREDVLGSLRTALEWCLSNLKEYNGLAAYVGADLQSARTMGGLHNQSWKDNAGAYQYEDGTFTKQPIYDVFVNGLFWAALSYGSELFQSRDKDFAEELSTAAKKLKKRFNDPKTGFLMKSKGLNYFAEALDGDGRQLTGVCADVGMCLWASYRGECIIDKHYLDDVVERLSMSDMLNPEAGLRNYSSSTDVKNLFAGGYHRSPNTYWPFVSGLVAEGFNTFGFGTQAKKMATASLKGAGRFEGCIEVFLETSPGRYEVWQNPAASQQSAKDQAWSAAAIYFMSNFLLKAN